jgi:hypothetical protein
MGTTYTVTSLYVTKALLVYHLLFIILVVLLTIVGFFRGTIFEPHKLLRSAKKGVSTREERKQEADANVGSKVGADHGHTTLGLLGLGIHAGAETDATGSKIQFRATILSAPFAINLAMRGFQGGTDWSTINPATLGVQ